MKTVKINCPEGYEACNAEWQEKVKAKIKITEERLSLANGLTERHCIQQGLRLLYELLEEE